ncbi:MAG: hypothetical protein J6S67_06950 [Methanobrevibacter sp.]|nr:hypothetical protein [Methanobrevibacter sp.]
MKKFKLTAEVAKGNKSASQFENTVENNILTKEFINVTPEDFRKRYKFYENNRGNGTDVDRAEEMAYDIANECTWWMIQPVCVDKRTNVVIDGNHSGMAMLIAHEKYGVNLLIPVELVDVPSKMTTSKAVQTLNNERLQWTLEMYIINYIKEGNKNYKNLQDMADELGYFYKEDNGKIKWRYLSSLAGKVQQEKLRDGTYVLDKQQKEKQIKFGTEILELWRAAGMPKPAAWIESFITAVFKLKEVMGRSFDSDKLKKILGTEKARKEFDGSQSAKTWQERISGWFAKSNEYIY